MTAQSDVERHRVGIEGLGPQLSTDRGVLPQLRVCSSPVPVAWPGATDASSEHSQLTRQAPGRSQDTQSLLGVPLPPGEGAQDGKIPVSQAGRANQHADGGLGRDVREWRER